MTYTRYSCTKHHKSYTILLGNYRIIWLSFVSKIFTTKISRKIFSCNPKTVTLHKL